MQDDFHASPELARDRSMSTKIKMENVRSDIDLRLPDPSKGSTNRIEWNVDMKVTVSNVKKSKVFQRSRFIVFLLMVIVLTIVLSHLGREVRALQMQMQCVNVNLLVLMSKYDRLNRSLNRVWLQRRDDRKHEAKRFLAGAASLSRTLELAEGIRNATNGNSYAYNSIITFLNPIGNAKEKYSTSHGGRDKNEENDSIILKSLTKLEVNEKFDGEDKSNSRIERAILSLEKQNSTELDSSEFYRDSVERDNGNDDNDYHDDLDTWSEPRSRRSRRDEGRGPLVATFVGAIPEQHVTDTVYIGPWVKSRNNNTQYSLNKFHLVEDKKSIEVTVTGLYMISAQIFYFGEPTNYSYWILLSSEGKSSTQKLVKCSTASSTSATEVSCYTSVITPLQRGDRVYIQQQERDRLINMREGHSYIQLVLLSNNIHNRRLR